MQLDFSLLMQNPYSSSMERRSPHAQNFFVSKVHKYLNWAFVDLKHVLGIPALIATAGRLPRLTQHKLI